ncbi:hypothetical protein N7450_000370 [Penicillium hetheringtonii]|uniref:RNase H type-1 domain-containing protein n=1 Tax=Penicillium hetheringtonii TaxID=911720 RepID=A0AAD6E218_9EURO|nr:hypothetical protein N7450_000370 [Penicillium hetheringtonii]
MILDSDLLADKIRYHLQRQCISIASYSEPSGQQIIHAIISGHCEISGNETADRLAKGAATPGKIRLFSPLISRERAHIRQEIHDPLEKEWEDSKTGNHLRHIDSTLPAKYSGASTDPCLRHRTYLLKQLRSRHCWLSTYAKAFRF